jgi:hypothetical protein
MVVKMAWESTDMSEGSCSLTLLRISSLITRIVGKNEALLIEKGCMERYTVGSRNWVPLSTYRSIDLLGLLYLLVLWPNWFLCFSQVMQASAFLRCHGADLYYGTDVVFVCSRV